MALFRNAHHTWTILDRIDLAIRTRSEQKCRRLFRDTLPYNTWKHLFSKYQMYMNL